VHPGFHGRITKNEVVTRRKPCIKNAKSAQLQVHDAGMKPRARAAALVMWLLESKAEGRRQRRKDFAEALAAGPSVLPKSNHMNLDTMIPASRPTILDPSRRKSDQTYVPHLQCFDLGRFLLQSPLVKHASRSVVKREMFSQT
jgi:hypothetical protein